MFSLKYGVVVMVLCMVLVGSCGRRPDVLERPVEGEPLRSYPQYDDPREEEEEDTS